MRIPQSACFPRYLCFRIPKLFLIEFITAPRMDPRVPGGVHITRHYLGIPARVRCGGRNVCLAGELSAHLSLRRLLTYLERRVTIDSYTRVISLWSALLLMMILFPSV